jgi:hypothetical protein
LRLDERESQALLRLGNRAAAQIHQPGLAIVNKLQGDEQGNVLTRLCLIEQSDGPQVRRSTLSQAVGNRRPPRVFDGHRGADARQNVELRAALKAHPAAAGRTWIGAQLDVSPKDPRREVGLNVDFTRDSHRHLAVIGAGTPQAASILQWATIGLAANNPSARFELVDLLREDDEAPVGVADATAEVLNRMGRLTTLTQSNDSAELVPRWAVMLDEQTDDKRIIVVWGFDRLLRMGESLDPSGESYMPDTPRTLLESMLTSAAVRGVHLLGWWSTFEALGDAVGAQEHNFGMRVYLQVPHQQLVVATSGAADEGISYPLAFWHDVARGRQPREFQTYEPFGSAASPDWIGGA